MTTNRQDIAIIGAGISGLGAAYALRKNHNITLYEKTSSVGGHARTVSINYNGTPIAVDTGFIVYNEKNYPNLTTLFRELDVPAVDTSMTFGVTAEDGSLEWGAESLNALFGQRGNLLRPSFYRFLADILKFNRNARKMAEMHPTLTLGELIKHMHLGVWFKNYYILPMGGAIWSCPLESMLVFPAKFFVDFFDAHGLLTVTQQPQWRTIVGGSRGYIDRIMHTIGGHIQTACGVRSVARANGKITVTDDQGTVRYYDHAIMACHASEALSLLVEAGKEERDVLGAFRLQKNTAYLHKDASLMPRRKACWSSWVYYAGPPGSSLCVTYWMNRLQHIDEKYPLFVTLNPLRHIAEADIFDQHVFYHPVYNPRTVEAQKQLAAIQGKSGIWYCGAYTRNGFHEDGLASALDVASHFGGVAA